CACCRRVWDYLSDERWRTAVLVAERYAEGQATDAELAHAYKKAGRDLSWEFRFTDAGVQQAAVRWLTRAVDETNGDDPFWGADRRPLVQLAVNVGAHTRMVAASQRDQRRRPPPAPRPTGTRAECLAHAALIHDIFGNPFRPAAVEPAWLRWNGGTVAQMARSIYEERRFEEMPVLADALEEAGCTDAAILDHCRKPGPHVC